MKHGYSFGGKNKVFTGFCLVFILMSCVPGLIFYQESKSGDFVLPDRHQGADSSSAVSVGAQNVASGDIISHGYFDRLFDDHAHIDMGDIYLPYIFFLILVCSVFARVNRLIFFLLFNILALSLITITSAGGVHHFLYQHIIIFKFIRNIYYFFWLAMLPMGLLLFVTAFKALLTTIDNSTHKGVWLAFIIMGHLLFALFLFSHHGVLWGAWSSIFISLAYFLIYFRYPAKVSYPAGFCLFLLAVFIQSVQVYGFLDDKLFQYQYKWAHPTSVVSQEVHQASKTEVYYAASWFTVLANYTDYLVFSTYRNKQFIIYDNVYPSGDNPESFKLLETAMAGNLNAAYVSKFESNPSDWRNDPNAPLQADDKGVSSGEVSMLYSDANTWLIKTQLAKSRFLVINDCYNKDWHAFINGHQAPLLRANVAFKGLWVPAGESKVLLRFSSPKRYLFHFALIALFIGAFVYFLILIFKERKRTGSHA